MGIKDYSSISRDTGILYYCRCVLSIYTHGSTIDPTMGINDYSLSPGILYIVDVYYIYIYLWINH